MGEESGEGAALEGGEQSGVLTGSADNNAGSVSWLSAAGHSICEHNPARNNSASSEANHSVSGSSSSALSAAKRHPFSVARPSCLGCSVPARASLPLRVRDSARVAGESGEASGSAGTA